jgi:hypothetical protein
MNRLLHQAYIASDMSGTEWPQWVYDHIDAVQKILDAFYTEGNIGSEGLGKKADELMGRTYMDSDLDSDKRYICPKCLNPIKRPIHDCR